MTPRLRAATKLTLEQSFLALLKQNKVKLSAVAPAKLKGGTVSFPVSGGKFDPTAAKGTVEHEGALVFKAGGGSIPIKALQLKTTSRRTPLSAKVGGSQLKLAEAKSLAVTRRGFGNEVAVTKLTLSAKLATRLAKKLRLREAFKAGLPLRQDRRTAANPETIALLGKEQGRTEPRPLLPGQARLPLRRRQPDLRRPNTPPVPPSPCRSPAARSPPTLRWGRCEARRPGIPPAGRWPGVLGRSRCSISRPRASAPKSTPSPRRPTAARSGGSGWRPSRLSSPALANPKARTVSVAGTLALDAATAAAFKEVFAKPQGKERGVRGGGSGGERGVRGGWAVGGAPIAMRIEEIRAGLAGRLRSRQAEIEQAVLTRIRAVADPFGSNDPEYTDGLRETVVVAIEFGIEAVERSEDNPPPIPTVLLSQARLAARHEVKLETVLRRYLAGYTLLGDFLIEESKGGGGGLNKDSLKRLLRVQAGILDRLIAAVSEEYAREAPVRSDTSEQRRGERIKRLLAGELIDTSEWAYDFEAHHLGLIASGPGANQAILDLGAALDRSLLVVPCAEDIVWAWLGGRRGLEGDPLKRLLGSGWPARVSLAIGEPGEGVSGWRLTHQQARAALPIALRSDGPVRYADVALLASMLRDDLLTTSLRRLYLAPLECERDGGKVMRDTLRAYVAAHRNVSSAAAALGVNRHTVTNRLRTIEERLGRPLDACTVEIDAALSLQSLGYPLGSHPVSGE